MSIYLGENLISGRVQNEVIAPALFSIVPMDHELSYTETQGYAPLGSYVYKEAVSGSRYGYPDFYQKCLLEFQDLENTTETVDDITVTVNANGHKFYSIDDKSVIDALFESRGEAWFYGIDEENERVFLPRSTRFKFGSSGEVGEYQEAGLPNITGGLEPYVDINRNVWGAFWANKSAGTNPVGTTGSGNGSHLEFNASRSSSIYGNSSTVEYSSTKMIPYMVVGNTTQKSAVTDVIDVTTSENDTIPLGFSQYSGEVLSPKLGWLKSAGQWNSGALYSTFYNTAVSKIGQAFADGAIVEHTDSYTDYDLVINQEDETFRLPLLDGSESILSDKYEDWTLGASGDTHNAPANGFVYFSKRATATNQHIRLSVGGTQTSIQNLSSVVRSSGADQDAAIYVPCKKGDLVMANYTVAGTLQALKFYYAQGSGSLYFKVSNAVQNLELLNVGEVTDALTLKADTSFANIANGAKSLCASYPMPSNKSVVLTFGANGTAYLAPANGWFAFNFKYTGSSYWGGAYLRSAEGNIIMGFQPPNSSATNFQGFLPAKKGDYLVLSYNNMSAYDANSFRFHYAAGSESEAE